MTGSPDLVLLEGVPGAGKSTAAQLIGLALRRSGGRVRWWYEEEVDHVLFGFHGMDDVHRLVTELRERRFEGVCEDALGRWRDLVRGARAPGGTVVADGCLLGYLTWSLYWADAPRPVIDGYVAHVAGILGSVDTVVLHLRPEDLAGSWRDLGASRGAEWMAGAVAGVEGSPAGVRMGLSGFDGLTRYWTGFLALADELMDRLTLRHLVVPVSAGGSNAAPSALERLGLDTPQVHLDRPARDHAGVYRGEGDVEVEVAVEDGALTISGVPGAWPRVPLLPVAPDVLELRSIPWRVRFSFDAGGHATVLDITGPALLETAAPGRLVRAR